MGSGAYKSPEEGGKADGSSTASASASATVGAWTAALFALIAAIVAIVACVLIGNVSGGAATCTCECPAAASSTAAASSSGVGVCPNPAVASGLLGVSYSYNYNGLSLPMADARYAGLAAQLKPIGSHTAVLAEASDAGGDSGLVKDGTSGDVAWPAGALKPIFTVGEYDPTTGYLPVGVPDGQGLYKPDDSTIRVVFQAESYGHLPGRNPSYYLKVNDGAANFTGSHVAYLDYDAASMKNFLETDSSAAGMSKGAGSLIEKVMNLDKQPVGALGSGAPHYGDTAADGTWATLLSGPEFIGVWAFHSLCAAHLEEAGQWGEGMGVVDNLFITNEEWTDADPAIVEASGFVGLTAHVIDIATKTSWAVAGFSAGGFEKIVEISCGSSGPYVCFAVSGYNGPFGDVENQMIARRQAAFPTRSDGTDWIYTNNVHPSRIYIGLKGFYSNGTACPGECEGPEHFLERNGLSYGRVYGFAVANDVADRDAWHLGNDREITTEMLDGQFVPTEWMWDGVVRNFEFDQSWEFQEPPVSPDAASIKFWNAAGRDAPGFKTEHISPDPRGNSRFVQGSTAGYIGIYDMSMGNSTSSMSLGDVLDGLAEGELPAAIPAGYWIVEGETDVSDRVILNGKGQTSAGTDQTVNFSGGKIHTSLEDVDGLEWSAATDGDYLIIQEDSGNSYGERMFISKIPDEVGVKPTYHFIAQAGGSANTRNMAGVCVPSGTWTKATSSEFSGVTDMTGAIYQTELGGYARRQADASKPINEKFYTLGLQHGSCAGGIIEAFGLDRGGQIYAYQPDI